ncbi:MAG: hypothetical protein LBL21_02030 [Rickettsiales bacterium]|nr:hypothetical protein [Rickettsiales bacterium]
MSNEKKKQELPGGQAQSPNGMQMRGLFQSYMAIGDSLVEQAQRTSHAQLCDLYQEYITVGEVLLEKVRRTGNARLCDLLQKRIAGQKSLLGQMRRFDSAQPLDFAQQFDFMQKYIADRAPDIFAELPAEIKTVIDSKVYIIENVENGVITSETNALTSAELHNIVFMEECAKIHDSMERLYILSLSHNYYAYQVRRKGYPVVAEQTMDGLRRFFLSLGNEK